MAPEDARPEYVCAHGLPMYVFQGGGWVWTFKRSQYCEPCVRLAASLDLVTGDFDSLLPFEAAGGRA